MDAAAHDRPSRRREAAALVTGAILATVAVVLVAPAALAGGNRTPAAGAAPAGPGGGSPSATTLAPGDRIPFGQGRMGATGLGTAPSTDPAPGLRERPRRAAARAAAGANGGAAAGADGGTGTGSWPAPAPPSTWPSGVDVSSWQHPDGRGIDWRAVRRSGVRFVFVKATEGTGYLNPFFPGDRHAGWAAGLVVGAYHYARPAWPASTAADQARYFVARAGTSRGTNQLAPVLDLEATGGLSGARLRSWALIFLRTVETLTGRAPTLYSYQSFWTDVMGDTTAFARYPLWFALYGGGRGPGRLPGGWPGWRFWQHTPDGTVPGIEGTVDLDVYCCTFRSFWTITDGRDSDLWKAYAHSAWLRSLLGPPTREERGAGGGGRWQPFRRGLLFWSVATDAREVHGGIETKYLALGGTTSLLGPPLSDEENARAAGTRQSVFRGGRIFWSRAAGAHEVHGGILARYLALGDTASVLGAPTSDEYSVPAGRQSAFQHGCLRWDARTDIVSLITATPRLTW